MEFLPFVAFLAFGLVSALAQQSFFNRVAQTSGEVSTDENLVDEILDKPTHLIGAVGRETPRRLEALLRHWDDPVIERRRRIATLSIGASGLSFLVWIVVIRVT